MEEVPTDDESADFLLEDQSPYDSGEDSTLMQPNKKATGLHLKLLLFFTLFKIPHSAMAYLLNALLEEGIDVPRSVYLLQKVTEREDKKVKIARSTLNCGGDFAYRYLSIFNNLLFCIENNLLKFRDLYNAIDITINIDGLPLFHSSPVSLWPILFSVRNMSFIKPLPVAIYVGVGKPDFSGFLKELIAELFNN